MAISLALTIIAVPIIPVAFNGEFYVGEREINPERRNRVLAHWRIPGFAQGVKERNLNAAGT